MVQCVFLVPQVKICQSPIFVIFMSKNLSTNLCRRLRRINIGYQDERSLHFDLPNLPYTEPIAKGTTQVHEGLGQLVMVGVAIHGSAHYRAKSQKATEA